MFTKKMNFSTGYGLNYIIKLESEEPDYYIHFTVYEEYDDDEESLILRGYIKSDGCINFKRVTSSEGVLDHHCGIRDYLNESIIITEIYKQVYDIMNIDKKEDYIKREFILKGDK